MVAVLEGKPASSRALLLVCRSSELILRIFLWDLWWYAWSAFRCLLYVSDHTKEWGALRLYRQGLWSRFSKTILFRLEKTQLAQGGDGLFHHQWQHWLPRYGKWSTFSSLVLSVEMFKGRTRVLLFSGSWWRIWVFFILIARPSFLCEGGQCKVHVLFWEGYNDIVVGILVLHDWYSVSSTFSATLVDVEELVGWFCTEYWLHKPMAVWALVLVVSVATGSQ